MADTEPTSFSELRSTFIKRLLAVALVTDLLFIALAGFALWRSEALYQNRAEITTQNLSRALAEHINGALGMIDLTVLTVADEAESQLARGGIDAARLNAFIARHQARLPVLDGLRVVNSQGDHAYGTGVTPGVPTSIADRAYFTRLRQDPNAGLVVSDPLVGRVSGKWSIILARRINQPDGSFAGLVYGTITLEQFITAFSSINVGPRGSITLRDTDLALIARRPEPEEATHAIGKKNGSPELVNAVRLQTNGGNYRSAQSFDKIERTYSYQKVANGPFYVIVGVAPQDYLAAWWKETIVVSALVAIFVLGTCLSAFLVYRGWLRRTIAGQILQRKEESLRQSEQALRESEVRFRSLLQDVQSVAVQGYSPDGTCQYWNQASERLYGYTAQEAIGRNLVDLIVPPEMRTDIKKAIQRTAETAQSIPPAELSLMRKNGSRVEVFSSHVVVKVPGRHQELFALDIDLTQRKRAEEALRESETLLKESQKTAGLGSYVLHIPNGLWKSSSMLDLLLGIDQKFERSVAGWLSLVHPDDRSMMADHFQNEVLGQRKTFDKEYRIVRHDNQVERWVHGLGNLQFDAHGQPLDMYGTIQDITDRKRAEDEKAKLESLLQQSQKMESVGRLAGGVAHDFNNMLHAILGNVYIAQEDLPPGSPVRDSLEEINKCAQRAADLTRQLLAFARRQTIAPRILDLNQTVEGLLKLLRRLIGEPIQLIWIPAANLGSVKMDPTQIDQILTNLCVNARDAIGGVGKITIETQKASFDDAYCARNPGFAPGEYLLLSVNDTGCGMDTETQTHIFEPFFTTKGVGKGTGLGLATLYGIVKQNSGFIHVDSKLGVGTTFKLYLPLYAGPADVSDADAAANLPMASGETVLLVEDEPAILAIAWKFLERLGYTVLTASAPSEAIRLAKTHPSQIHLLMTDVVMPEMNGRDLAKQLVFLHPKLKYVFMSGYTSDIIAHHGVLDQDIRFIQKPFSIEDLAVTIRKVLSA